MTVKEIKELISIINANCLGTDFGFIVAYDMKYSIVTPQGTTGRIFIQAKYKCNCTKTGEEQEWKGAKHYLSDYMTHDEIIKAAFKAFKTAVEHEILEGFKVHNTILFNPHCNYMSLLEVSNKEVRRNETK